MKVLVAPQFIDSVEKLLPSEKAIVYQQFKLLSQLSKDDLKKQFNVALNTEDNRNVYEIRVQSKTSRIRIYYILEKENEQGERAIFVHLEKGEKQSKSLVKIPNLNEEHDN